MSNFLWSDKTDDHRKHWISWKQRSSPKTEGGLDVRTFKDGLETAQFKQSLDFFLKIKNKQKPLWLASPSLRASSNPVPDSSEFLSVLVLGRVAKLRFCFTRLDWSPSLVLLPVTESHSRLTDYDMNYFVLTLSLSLSGPSWPGQEIE